MFVREAGSIKSDNLRSLLVSEVTIELPLQVYPNFIVESDQSQSVIFTPLNQEENDFMHETFGTWSRPYTPGQHKKSKNISV